MEGKIRKKVLVFHNFRARFPPTYDDDDDDDENASNHCSLPLMFPALFLSDLSNPLPHSLLPQSS